MGSCLREEGCNEAITLLSRFVGLPKAGDTRCHDAQCDEILSLRSSVCTRLRANMQHASNMIALRHNIRNVDAVSTCGNAFLLGR